MQSFFRNILIAAALLPVPLAGTAQNAAAFLSVVPDARSAATVSYTHLTLPTNSIV